VGLPFRPNTSSDCSLHYCCNFSLHASCCPERNLGSGSGSFCFGLSPISGSSRSRSRSSSANFACCRYSPGISSCCSFDSSSSDSCFYSYLFRANSSSCPVSNPRAAPPTPAPSSCLQCSSSCPVSNPISAPTIPAPPTCLQWLDRFPGSTLSDSSQRRLPYCNFDSNVCCIDRSNNRSNNSSLAE